MAVTFDQINKFIENIKQKKLELYVLKKNEDRIAEFKQEFKNVMINGGPLEELSSKWDILKQEVPDSDTISDRRREMEIEIEAMEQKLELLKMQFKVDNK